MNGERQQPQKVCARGGGRHAERRGTRWLPVRCANLSRMRFAPSLAAVRVVPALPPPPPPREDARRRRFRNARPPPCLYVTSRDNMADTGESRAERHASDSGAERERRRSRLRAGVSTAHAPPVLEKRLRAEALPRTRVESATA